MNNIYTKFGEYIETEFVPPTAGDFVFPELNTLKQTISLLKKFEDILEEKKKAYDKLSAENKALRIEMIEIQNNNVKLLMELSELKK